MRPRLQASGALNIVVLIEITDIKHNQILHLFKNIIKESFCQPKYAAVHIEKQL